MKDKKNAIPAVPTHNSQNAKRSAEAQHEIPIATGSRPERDVPAQGQKGHAKDADFQASESVPKRNKAATKAKTNGRNGAEHRGLEPANHKTSASPRSVVADREKTSPQTQSQNGKSIGTNNPSSPPSSSGPLKMKAGGEGPSVPSLAAAERTFGTSDGDLGAELLLQVIRAMPTKELLGPDGNHALAALYGIGPRDTNEGLLATQMVTGHNFAMELFRRAALPGQSPELMELYLNLATKLERTYIAQMEALDRHRGKGEQKMNVEQVHMHERAQGIVGPFSHQGTLDVSAEGHGKSN
jgi:hypothetical protein